MAAGALWLLLTSANSPAGAFADGSREVVSRIAPGLAIITEIDNGAPYVSQQFSIIYALRALKAPKAIDIDPQQFAGFWTELSPPEADARPSSQTLDNQPASQYLLRQVIAFPLSEGRLQLPPLRLKIKMPDSRSDSGDWDLVCSSEPVTVDVLPIPSSSDHRLPLVGNLEGSLTPVGGSGRDEVILELKGTANLAFFDPLQWMVQPAGLVLSARPTEWDKMVQTRDIAGKRQITLIQRRCWGIRIFGQAQDRMRVGDIGLRVFQPLTGHWAEKMIAGVALAGLDERPVAGTTGQPHREPEETRVRPVWVSASIAGLLIAVVAWAFTRARSLHRRDWAARGLTSLGKTSAAASKPFLDTAHKLMERHAAQAGILGRIGGGDSELDRFWNEIERLRFGRQSPSPELRNEILQFLKNLLANPKSS